jgi:hypothetical protein
VKENDAVVRAALDYFEGWYDGDVERLDRVLHDQLVKRWPAQLEGGGARTTTKQRMLELAREGAGREDKTDDPIEVTVADVHHDIAAAVVRSAQYREYLHLVHTAEGWQIVGAWWQLTDPEVTR